jgi:hypothetical protein
MVDRRMTIHGDFHVAGPTADLSVGDVVQTRKNLGLGNAALLDVGTTAGTVAAGDHTHESGGLGGGIGGAIEGSGLRAYAKLANTFTTTLTAPQNTGLSLPVLAGKTYLVRAWLLCQSASTSRGVGISLDGPAGSTVAISVSVPHTNASVVTYVQNDWKSPLTGTQFPLQDVSALCEITGIVTPSQDGTLSVCLCGESNGYAVRLMPNSIFSIESIEVVP